MVLDPRPNRASVLGYTLHSSGFDPGYDGPIILDMRSTSMSRILAGNEPTYYHTLSKLDDALDVLWDRAHWSDMGMARIPFLHLARRMANLAPADRAKALDMVAPRFRSWSSRVAGTDVDMETARTASVLPFAQALGYPATQDAPSLFAAIARLAGYAVGDIADMMGDNGSFGAARDIMQRGTEPPAEFYAAMFDAIDRHAAKCNETQLYVDATPVDVGLAWQRHRNDAGQRLDFRNTWVADTYIDYDTKTETE